MALFSIKIWRNFQLVTTELEDLEGKESEINAFLREYEKEHAIYNEVQGITFWNGSSYETVAIFDEDYASKEIEEEILKAFQDAEFVPTVPVGYYDATSGGFIFTKRSYPSYYEARAQRI